MNPPLSEHIYLTPDRPMPDWNYQDALGRLRECVKFLSLWDFLTECERRRIEARIARWYAMSPPQSAAAATADNPPPSPEPEPSDVSDVS